MARSRLSQALLLLSVAPVAFGQQAYDLTGSFWFTHDPSIIKQGDTWYVFATGKAPHGGQIPVRCSDNLKSWRYCDRVFASIPDWIQKESPGTQDLWAPDISKYKDEYRLYYAFSLFGKNTSGIALATSRTLDPKSPDYKWTDRGLVLRSTETDDFNAIDPNFVEDAQGRCWLAFGSFWGGIKMRRLADDGKLLAQDPKLYSLATRAKPGNPAPAKPGLPPDWQAVEAPFIAHHGNYYYLFVSWDLCCKGGKSTYRTMVGRATQVTGPYLDQDGKSMAEGGGTQILGGNSAWSGPGGESALLGGADDLLVFHAYDSATGVPGLQISTIDWSNGWPKVGLESHHAPAPTRPERKQ